jgi:hypothetical protein
MDKSILADSVESRSIQDCQVNLSNTMQLHPNPNPTPPPQDQLPSQSLTYQQRLQRLMV